MSAYEAIYTSQVTYGLEQIKGHTYKITLTDTEWNSPDSALPITQAPDSQSITWPIDNPKQPLFFTFLVYQKVK
jgi:hypothetical protein